MSEAKNQNRKSRQWKQVLVVGIFAVLCNNCGKCKDPAPTLKHASKVPTVDVRDESELARGLNSSGKYLCWYGPLKQWDAYFTWVRGNDKVEYKWNGDAVGIDSAGLEAIKARLANLPRNSKVLVYPVYFSVSGS